MFSCLVNLICITDLISLISIYELQLVPNHVVEI